MATVSWPRACIGCGETNPAALIDHSYVYKHSQETGRTYLGGNTYRVSYRVTSLPVSSFVCGSCKRVARRRYGGVLAGLLVWIVGGWILFGFLSDFNIAAISAVTLVFSFIVTVVALVYAITRANPVRHYHKVRYHPARGNFRYILRSSAYEAVFRRANPGEDIKQRAMFP